MYIYSVNPHKSRIVIGSVLHGVERFLVCSMCRLLGQPVGCGHSATLKLYATCMRMERMRLRNMAYLQKFIFGRPCRM